MAGQTAEEKAKAEKEAAEKAAAEKKKADAEAKKKAEEEAKKKAAEAVAITWPHVKGEPGEQRDFYGVTCKADAKGVFRAKVSKDKAELEAKRENQRRFKIG
jgi:hypothetical protein